MYESDQSTATQTLANANPTVFSDDTIAKIIALTTSANDTSVKFDTVTPSAGGNVTVPAGAEVVYVAPPVSPTIPVNVIGEAPVVALQGNAGFNVVITAPNATDKGDAAPDRIVIGSAGADRIVVSDALDSQITVGNGDTVVTGLGDDTIIAGFGNSTIQGGGGDDIVQMTGSEDDFTVTVVNGRAVVAGDNGTITDITGIQYVQLSNGDALVFAEDKQQAAITTLYETTFGRTADAKGLQYWFDQAEKGVSLTAIASAFTSTTEFTQANANLSNDDFITQLYQRTFGRAPDADGAAYWAAALSTGGATRAQLIASFADIASNTIAGTGVEANVVGAVTIVQNII